MRRIRGLQNGVPLAEELTGVLDRVIWEDFIFIRFVCLRGWSAFVAAEWILGLENPLSLCPLCFNGDTLKVKVREKRKKSASMRSLAVPRDRCQCTEIFATWNFIQFLSTLNIRMWRKQSSRVFLSWHWTLALAQLVLLEWNMTGKPIVSIEGSSYKRVYFWQAESKPWNCCYKPTTVLAL